MEGREERRSAKRGRGSLVASFTGTQVVYQSCHAKRPCRQGLFYEKGVPRAWMVTGGGMRRVEAAAAAAVVEMEPGEETDDNDSDNDEEEEGEEEKVAQLEEVRIDYAKVKCETCGRGDGEDQMLLCDKCDRGFHMYCIRPILVSVPAGEWICRPCGGAADQAPDFPKLQTKIVDFFRIQKLAPPPIRAFDSKIKRRRRHGSGCFTTPKKNRKLLLHTPTSDPERRLQQMASLATALTSAGVDFSDELTYFPGLAPRSSNCPSLEEGGMQVMGKEDKATFARSKSMCRRGLWPPLMVTYDAREGFVVEADSPIKDMTIIVEYTGDVDFMSNRVHDPGNSLMGLLFPKDPSKELVICPDKRGNLARFVSGINNHSLDGKKKQNVRCVRFDVDGEARAILVAIRDIHKGERLYYDYNGYHKEYPTQHFV